MSALIEPAGYILLGVPVLFIIGALFHFLYQLSGESFIVGMIAPVDESVFQHTKLVVMPIILWWSIYYLLNSEALDPRVWFGAAMLSLLCAVIAIPTLYYLYTGALGVHSLAADIFILFAALLIGQLVGLHYYSYGSGMDIRVSLGVMAAIVLLFALLTVIPPRIPLFKDDTTGSYGI